MAIMSPADMPSVMKVRSEPMKKYVLSKLVSLSFGPNP